MVRVKSQGEGKQGGMENFHILLSFTVNFGRVAGDGSDEVLTETESASTPPQQKGEAQRCLQMIRNG